MKNPVQISDIRRLLPTLSLSLIIGAIDLPTIISFAILIYSGDLASFAGMGIGMILFGGLIVQLVIAFTSSIPGMMGGPQDSPAAILGLMAVAIVAQMPGAGLKACITNQYLPVSSSQITTEVRKTIKAPTG